MDLYTDIMVGLKQAIDYEKKNIDLKTVKMTMRPVSEFSASEVRDIRMKANLSQVAFAKFLGVSKKAVEAWEAGRNQPNGAASRLIELIAKDPEFPQKSGVFIVG